MMNNHQAFTFRVSLAILLLTAIPGALQAADGWGRLNPFNALPTPQWPEWATVKMPEVDLVPDWVKLPDVTEIPSDIARMHRRNMNAIGSAVNYLNPFKRKTVTRPIPPPTGARKTTPVSGSTSDRFWFPSFMENERRLGPSRSVSDFLDRPRIR